MKLPKRTNYKGFLVTSALVLTLSTFATLGGDLGANALSLPFGLGEIGPSSTKKKDTSDDKKTADPQTTTPVTQPTTPTAPATVNTATAPTTTSAATKTVTSTKEASAPVVKKVDTAAQVAQVATAQAVKSIQPTVYQSDKITTDTRDELYKAAAITAGVGALLYLLSYTRPWKWMYRNLVEAPKTVTQ